MANSRSGKWGNYYGSYYNESEPLTLTEMQVNARYIYAYLCGYSITSGTHGWSVQADSALLGNMQAESSINPGRWQSDDVGWTSGGYGLVQWTPTTKYINWCTSNGWSDPSEMDNNLARIIYEVENKIQWYATDSYNFSFEEFSKSTQDVGYLARAFLLNYERPADQSESVQAYREDLAKSWYTYLTGIELPDEPLPDSSKKDNKFNWIIFAGKRRRNGF